MSVDDKAAGVVTASTGNHGLSIAWAARAFWGKGDDLRARGSQPSQGRRHRRGGRRGRYLRADFDEAKEHAEKLAAESGSRYAHPGNEPALIAGVATETLEILEDQPSIDAIVVPVGGGSGAAGACIVAKAMRPSHRRAVLRRPRRVPVLVRSGPGRGRDGHVCRRASDPHGL